MAFWRELPGKITKQQNGFGGGVNEGLPPLQIAENQASAMLNLVPSEGGAATVRGGRTALGASLGAGVDYLGAHGTSHLLAAAGGSLYKWTGSTWSSVGTGLTAGNAGDSCEFMGYTWFVNGAQYKKWDGTTLSNITGIPTGVKYIKEDDNRLWALADKKLSYSALRKGEDWTTALDSGAIDLENPYGENTTSLQVFGGRVMIFTDHTFEEIYGSTPDNYQKINGSLQVGCIAHRSFQEIRGRTYWLGHDGVYRYVGGVAPQKISTAVQGKIDSLNWSARSKANAWVDGDWYVLAIPTTTNEADTILVYDTIHNTWWVQDFAGVYPRQTVNFGGTLYMGAWTGTVNTLGGTTDQGNAISWSWATGARQENGFSRQDIIRVFQVAELPTGSTLSLAVSPSVTGDSDWTTIGSMTAGTGYQKKAFYFSPSAAANLNWMRLKVSGTGPATLHELVREVRVKERV